MAPARRHLFRKILLPLDGSANAEAALPWVRRFAGHSPAEVVLLRVLATEYPMRGPSFLAGAPEATRHLQGVERELNFDGIPSKIVLKNGSVPRTILDVARREECDLIAISTRGASKVVRWLLGGVTEQILRRSSVPVLVVRSGVKRRSGSHPGHLLVPLDGSGLSAAILPWASDLARFHRSRITLLHVVPRDGSASFRTPTPLAEAAAALRRRGIRTTILIREGDVGEEILQASERCDLVAMTTHGHGGFKRWLLGSVAERVLRHAPVPVFIYKGARRDPPKGGGR